MAEQENKQIEGTVEHAAQNRPSRFGVKVDGLRYDAWGGCGDRLVKRAHVVRGIG